MRILLFILYSLSLFECSTKKTSAIERKEMEDTKEVSIYDLSKLPRRRKTYKEIMEEERERKERLEMEERKRKERIELERCREEAEEMKRELQRIVVGALRKFFDD